MPIPAVTQLLGHVPTRYYLPTAVVVVALAVVRAFVQGPRTSRERDLHDRTILVTGGFSPFGLTVLQALAARGARIVALAPPEAPVAELVDVMRTETANEAIFAERVDLSSRVVLDAFAAAFLKSLKDGGRLDALLLLHEYPTLPGSGPLAVHERRARARASFALLTTLLPGFLAAPPTRDARIVLAVNAFGGAAARGFPGAREDAWAREGDRALRAVALAAHLQRVLDKIPGAALPDPEQEAPQHANIAAVVVSPGVCRTDTVAPVLCQSWLGLLLYLVLQPILRIVTKSPASAAQTVLHALFAPRAGEEALVPGALYADCAVVQPPAILDETVGRSVWEDYEALLTEWVNEDDKLDTSGVDGTSASAGHVPGSDPAQTDGHARRRKAASRGHFSQEETHPDN